MVRPDDAARIPAPRIASRWPTILPGVRSPNVLQHPQERRLDVVRNIPKNNAEEELAETELRPAA